MARGSVVVFGATTEPGSELCRLLGAEGRHVVAISTGEGDISSLAPLDLEIRTTNATTQAAVKTVMKNLPAPQAVVSLVSYDAAINVINAAIGAGVGRFIMVTPIGGGESRKTFSLLKRIFTRSKLTQMTLVEDHLRASKLSWTILRTGPLGGRKPSGNGILLDNPLAYGAINAKNLARIVCDVLDNNKTVGRVFSAIDAKRVKIKDGTPAVAAEV